MPSGPANFLAYLLPADAVEAAALQEAERRQQQPLPRAAERYEWVREYSMDIKKLRAADSFLIVLADDGSALYNELSARIELTRRSAAERVHSGINALRPAAISLTRTGEVAAEDETERLARRRVVSGPGRELLEYKPGVSGSQADAAADDEPEAATE